MRASREARWGMTVSSTSAYCAIVYWFASIIACPTIMIILAVLFEVPSSPESFFRPLPWTWHAIEILGYLHIVLSVLAVVLAFRAFRQGPLKIAMPLLATVLVLASAAITCVIGSVASMAVSGRYL